MGKNSSHTSETGDGDLCSLLCSCVNWMIGFTLILLDYVNQIGVES